MRRPRLSHDALVPLIAVLTLPLGILALLFASFEAAAAVFVIGWFLLTPVVAILGDELEFEDEPTADENPIDRLRTRYAEGEIGETEFERRLDALLETEGLDPEDEDAIDRAIERLGDEGDVEVERE